MTRTRVTLLTVGDPSRVTGGYLFHRRLAERAPDFGAELRFVSIPELPLPWAMAAGPAWLFARATRTADVLVLDSIAASAAAPWLRRVRAPIVGMLHQPPGGIDAPRVLRRFRAPFDRHAYRACEILMVASDWLAAELVAAGVPGDRLRVVPPGKDLDVGAGAPTRDDALGAIDRAGLRRGRLMAAVCVANWLPRKGIVELLEAVAGLPDDVVTLHLVGDTATRGGYAGRVRDSSSTRTFVTGSWCTASSNPRRCTRCTRPSMPSCCRASRSHTELSGERRWRRGSRWSAGGPATCHSWPTTAATAYSYRSATSRSSVEAIEWLARDPALRERLGSAAHARAAARPTWDQTAARFFAIIDEVLSAGHDRSPTGRSTDAQASADS